MGYSYDRRVAKVDVSGLTRKYMSMLGVKSKPIVKLVGNVGGGALGRCRWKPGVSTTTIEIQRSVGDPETFERILAHEMAHHAVYMDHYKVLEGMVEEYGMEEAQPHILKYLNGVINNRDSHGKEWWRYVNIINGKMGAKFVTEKSDTSFIIPTAKPFYVLVARFSNGQYGIQVASRLSSTMKHYIKEVQEVVDARLLKTNEVRYQFSAKIGSKKWSTSSALQGELRQLHEKAAR